MLVFPFLVQNHETFHSDKITVNVRPAPLKLIRGLKDSLGLKNIEEEIQIDNFGLVSFRCGEQISDVGKSHLEMTLPPGHQYGIALAIKDNGSIKGSALFLIEQMVNGVVVGGMGILVKPKNKTSEGPLT